MGASYDLPIVDRFIAGTIGTPGQRVFFLQAVAGDQVVSLRLEKQQVALLAEHLARLIEGHELPEVAPAHMGDLVEPLTTEWIVGSMMVAINEAAGRVVVIAQELVDDEDDDSLLEGDEPGEARVALTRDQAEAFVEGARNLVIAGRPICRLCGGPMDPDGHACPRWN
ncbi:MAG TPA: DUF3090 family protein [Microthrixaceae bacterium]|nr:DUF3090 family protein [Microthrixaceae bacterium]